MKPPNAITNPPRQMNQGLCGYPYGSLPLMTSFGGKFVENGSRLAQKGLYPGDRPLGSFVLLNGIVHPLHWQEGEWMLQPKTDGEDWCGLDVWLDSLGAELLAKRQACLAYGSNLCPDEIQKFANNNPVVVLSGLLLGAAAAYCSTSRDDGQIPAGVVSTYPNRGELHGLVLVDAHQRRALDAKEGVSRGVYQRGVIAADSVDFVLENGTRWHGSLGVYLQGTRSLALKDEAPVCLTEVNQHDFATLSGLGSTAVHGLDFAQVAEFPSLTSAGIPLFSYGTLQPNQFRYDAVANFIDAVSPDSIHGALVSTGQDYPGLVSSSDGEVLGTLLYPKQGQELFFLDRCDAIEGHPLLFRRALTRTTSGTLAWVYFWQTPDSMEETK